MLILWYGMVSGILMNNGHWSCLSFSHPIRVCVSVAFLCVLDILYALHNTGVYAEKYQHPVKCVQIKDQLVVYSINMGLEETDGLIAKKISQNRETVSTRKENPE